jgi:hypothetical protein
MTSAPTISASPSGFAAHPVLHVAIIVIVVVVALGVVLIVPRRRS